MKKAVIIILLLSSVCFGDIKYSHQKPNADSTLDLGSIELLWRYIYGDSFTDGTALWESNSLSGFTSIEGTTLTDGTFTVTEGIISVGIWNGTDIDISDYTNLLAGTNITLFGDTLNVDDAFLVNNASDLTTGTITAGGFTTTGTATTDVLVVGSNAPGSITATGTAGTITWDSNYIYVAIANNSWKRAALSTWGVTGETMIYEDTNTMVFEDGNTMIYD